MAIAFGAQGNILENSDFLLTAGLLLLALVGGGFVIWLLDRWKKRQLSKDNHRSIDALSTYRTMYERGEISKAEYEAIRGHVSQEARNEILDRLHRKPGDSPP